MYGRFELCLWFGKLSTHSLLSKHLFFLNKYYFTVWGIWIRNFRLKCIVTHYTMFQNKFPFGKNCFSLFCQVGIKISNYSPIYMFSLFGLIAQEKPALQTLWMMQRKEASFKTLILFLDISVMYTSLRRMDTVFPKILAIYLFRKQYKYLNMKVFIYNQLHS